MKTKRISRLLPLATMLLLVGACGDEETLTNNTSTHPGNLASMTFTAEVAQTRTQLVDGTKVYWTSGDVIGVYSVSTNGSVTTSESSQFTTDIPEGTSTATTDFTGEANPTAIHYMAVYPQNGFTNYSYTTDGETESLMFRLPTEQDACAGSFANGLNFSIATADSPNASLLFKNICALVKFSIAENENVEDLQSVTLTDLGGNALSGDMLWKRENATEYVSCREKAIPYVTLKGSFQANTNYYFVVSSIYSTDDFTTLTQGLTLTFTKADGTQFKKSSTKGVENPLLVGEILNLGTIELGEFLPTVDNADLVKAVTSKIPNIGLETNDDGTVSLTEENLKKIASVQTLDLSESELTDLSGIEYFTGLTTLNCSNNKLTTLSFGASSSPITRAESTGLTSLIELICSNNQLEELDVSGLISLETLDCNSNLLEELDVTDLTSLKYLNCNDNKLKELDVTGLTNLEKLWCCNNQLTTLNIKGMANLSYLECTGNQLASLDVTGLDNLFYLDCSGNQFESLDVENLIKLQTLWCGNNKLTSLNVKTLPALKDLRCYENQLVSLDVSGIDKLETLACSNNPLTSLTLGKLPGLKHLECMYADLTELNVSGLTGLEDLNCAFGNLVSLTVGDLPELTNLYCISNNLERLNLGNLPNLESLQCDFNNLSSLDVQKSNNLQYLACTNNQLTSLNVKGLASLNILDCKKNQLASLDVEGLTALTDLYCEENLLTSLDVSDLTSLVRLLCYTNQMTSFTISGLPNLEYVECTHNPLTSFTLTDLPALKTLYCENNRMTALDITALSNLQQLDCGNQYTLEGSFQQLTLYLTAAQYELWENEWKESWLNGEVITSVK